MDYYYKLIRDKDTQQWRRMSNPFKRDRETEISFISKNNAVRKAERSIAVRISTNRKPALL